MILTSFIQRIIQESQRQRQASTDNRSGRRTKKKMAGRMTATGGWWGESRRWLSGGYTKKTQEYLELERKLEKK